MSSAKEEEEKAEASVIELLEEDDEFEVVSFLFINFSLISCTLLSLYAGGCIARAYSLFVKLPPPTSVKDSRIFFLCDFSLLNF
jgi:hypothetical protein